jgi:hypothetical protein
MPQIVDENLDEVKYFLNDKEFTFTSNFIESQFIEDGKYELKIFASDIVGFNVTKSFTLNVDNTKPTLVIKSPSNDVIVSETLFIDFDVKDENLADTGAIKIILPNGEIRDQTQLKFDTSQLEEGQYKFQIFVEDLAGNKINERISFNVDHNNISPPTIIDEEPKSEQNNLLIIGIALGLVIGIVSVLLSTKKIKISVSN